MSLERLKEYCKKIAKVSRIAIAFILIIIVCETLSFMWQALMPSKLTGFFEVIRIYEPFISNIDNTALCLFELSGSLVNNLFVFGILCVIQRMFSKLASTISLGSVTHDIKVLSLILIADAVAVPLVKSVCHSVFVGLPLQTVSVDISPIIFGAVLYFIAIIIQSKSVLKEDRE